jgi:hypothetical protein
MLNKQDGEEFVVVFHVANKISYFYFTHAHM